ncbi:MAG: LEA type 2 family protein [Salibacteraceae bacterium]
MKNLASPELAGISISSKNSIGDFGFMDLTKLTAAVASGNLPLSFTLNVEARNPNPIQATMNNFDWIALIDNTEIARGSMSQRVSIAANNGKAIIPIRVNTDLRDLMSSDSRDKLINFALNLSDAGGQPTRVKLKIKPTIMIGQFPLSYPGYLPVTKDFGN